MRGERFSRHSEHFRTVREGIRWLPGRSGQPDAGRVCRPCRASGEGRPGSRGAETRRARGPGTLRRQSFGSDALDGALAAHRRGGPLAGRERSRRRSAPVGRPPTVEAGESAAPFDRRKVRLGMSAPRVPPSHRAPLRGERAKRPQPGRCRAPLPVLRRTRPSPGRRSSERGASGSLCLSGTRQPMQAGGRGPETTSGGPPRCARTVRTDPVRNRSGGDGPLPHRPRWCEGPRAPRPLWCVPAGGRREGGAARLGATRRTPPRRLRGGVRSSP